jgi:hypothetical protein
MMNYFFKVLLTPSCWLQNYSHSKELDKWYETKLNEDCSFDGDRTHTAKLDGATVWIGNHPYASFTRIVAGETIRPSRAMILRLADKLITDLLNKP